MTRRTPQLDPGPAMRAAGSAGDVPMVSVAFLMLAFLLLTASLADTSVDSIRPPRAAANAVESHEPLRIHPDGSLAYGAHSGPAALEAAAAAGRDPLPLRADRHLPAQQLASLLRRLENAGIGAVNLLVAPE